MYYLVLSFSVGLLAYIYKLPAQLVMRDNDFLIAWADQSCRDSHKQATIKDNIRHTGST